MTEELYICVPIEAVQDCGDHAVVSLGPRDDAVMLVMSAVSSPNKVAVLDRLQALCMEVSE